MLVFEVLFKEIAVLDWVEFGFDPSSNDVLVC